MTFNNLNDKIISDINRISIYNQNAQRCVPKSNNKYTLCYGDKKVLKNNHRKCYSVLLWLSVFLSLFINFALSSIPHLTHILENLI